MISVILPVYNSERYIEKCIDSIISQTYKEWELIIIDDGSTDNSFALCKNFADQDQRIKLIHQKNMGVTKARYNGVRAVQGEWITFIDSDDTLPSDALQNFSIKIDNTTDIIIGWIGTIQPTEDILSIEEYRSRNIRRGGVHVGPVAHLYRKSIFSEDIFDIPRDIYMGEDMLMNIRLAFKTDKPVKVIKKTVYNYFIENPNNTTNSYKLTLEYEEKLHQYRLASIPQSYHPMYMKDMISIRLYSLTQYIMEHPLEKKWKRRPLFIDLQKDISETDYVIPRRAIRLALKTNITILRILLIVYIKLSKRLLS